MSDNMIKDNVIFSCMTPAKIFKYNATQCRVLLADTYMHIYKCPIHRELSKNDTIFNQQIFIF